LEIVLPKYETVWYLNDQHNQWEEVSYRELDREERRAELREKDLRDVASGEIELGIRNHPKTPHFFEKRRIRTDIDPNAKESAEHEKQMQMVRSFLAKYEKHNFGYYERPWDKNDKGFDTLLKVKNYDWSTEVQFGLVYGKYIRFDILGRSMNEIQLTDKYPYVAIEIVDTHFHSQQAFRILLETTKNIPIIIAYYFIPVTPRYNCVNKPERVNSYAKIRLQCYIADGSFWFRNERVEELYEVTPDKPEVYYNLIREKLYENEYIKQSNSNANKP
jgi:hypothetical protein